MKKLILAALVLALGNSVFANDHGAKFADETTVVPYFSDAELFAQKKADANLAKHKIALDTELLKLQLLEKQIKVLENLAKSVNKKKQKTLIEKINSLTHQFVETAFMCVTLGTIIIVYANTTSLLPDGWNISGVFAAVASVWGKAFTNSVSYLNVPGGLGLATETVKSWAINFSSAWFANATVAVAEVVKDPRCLAGFSTYLQNALGC